MSSYAKIFDSLLTSSVWQESDKVVRVWIAMLLMKDQDGVVNAAVPGLAAFANVSRDECQQALEVLSGPDPFSRTPDLDGRRIVKVETGWRVVNHAKYRELLSATDRRAYKREHEQARRDRQHEAGAEAAAVVRRLRGQSVDTRGRT